MRIAISVRSAKPRPIKASVLGSVRELTLGSVSSRSKAIIGDTKTGNVDAAKKVGAALAALAREHQIQQAVFNRNGFLYHGRVKALADAAREAGLQL